MKKIIIIILLFVFVMPLFSQILIEDTNPKTLFVKEKSPYVYISIIIKTGIVSEAGYNAGMGTFISRFLIYQTKNRDHEELQEVFYSAGCNLSLETNLDYLEIKAITLKDTFPQAINIIGECLTEPKISKNILEDSKKDTLEKFTEEYDNPFQRLYDSFRLNLYVSNPYKKSLYGTYQSIKNIDKNNISTYYRENFQKNNMIICIVGDLEANKIQDSIQSAFSSGQIVKKRNIYEYDEKLNDIKIVDMKPYDNLDKLSYCVIGYLAPGVMDKDYYTYLVLSSILGYGKSSYIFQNIRQKYGIGYNIGFNYEKLRRQSHGYLYLSCIEDGTKINIAKQQFLKDIENIKINGVPDEDLNRSKVYLIEQNNINNLNLLTKAHNICWNEAICGSYERFSTFENEINKVTNEDIKNIAKKYFNNYVELRMISINE